MIEKWLEFSKLGNTKKILFFVNVVDIFILFFIDYIIASKMNINIKEKFLSSFGQFVLNIFSMEFFTVFVILLILAFAYYFIIPYVLQIIIYRLFEFAYLIITYTYRFILLIFNRIAYFSKLTKNKLVFLDTFLEQLVYYKLIQIDFNGKLLPAKRTNILLELYKDFSKDNLFEEFNFRLFVIFGCLYIISSNLFVNHFLSLTLGSISFLSLLFACFMSHFYIHYNDFKLIIENLYENLNEEQKKILDDKN